MHTPGPWTVGNESGRNCNIIFAGEHGVAGVYGVPMHCHISEVRNDPRYAVPLDDARLIAAAPDLLNSLKACLSWLEGMDGTQILMQAGNPQALEIINNARAAIAKATAIDKINV